MAYMHVCTYIIYRYPMYAASMHVCTYIIYRYPMYAASMHVHVYKDNVVQPEPLIHLSITLNLDGKQNTLPYLGFAASLCGPRRQ